MITLERKARREPEISRGVRELVNMIEEKSWKNMSPHKKRKVNEKRNVLTKPKLDREDEEKEDAQNKFESNDYREKPEINFQEKLKLRPSKLENIWGKKREKSTSEGNGISHTWSQSSLINQGEFDKRHTHTDKAPDLDLERRILRGIKPIGNPGQTKERTYIGRDREGVGSRDKFIS